MPRAGPRPSSTGCSAGNRGGSQRRERGPIKHGVQPSGAVAKTPPRGMVRAVAAPLLDRQNSRPKRVSLFGKLTQQLPVDQRTWPLIKRGVKTYTRRHVGKILIALVLMAIASAGLSGVPIFLKDIIDKAAQKAAFSDALAVGLVFLLVFLARGFANLGQEAIMSYVGNRIVADIQEEMYGHVLRADLAYFHNTATGHLISNFVNDTTKMRTVFSDTITGLGRDALSLAFLLAVMFWQDWLLGILIFGVFPLAVIPIAWLGNKMRRVSRRTQQEMAQFTTVLDESFQGIRHVKAYGMEDYETKRAGGVINKIFKLNFKATLTRGVNDPILEIFGGISVLGLMAYAGWQISESGKTLGTYMAFIFAFILAYEPMRKLARLYSSLQDGLGAAERVFHTLDMRPAITEKPDAGTLDVTVGRVLLDDVTFAYLEDAPALNGATIEAPAGKTVALVGPSGAGKTTVLNLIPRFYDVQAGKVTIDGTDVRDVTFASLRQAIGLVSQETSLFDDTIRANIAYGKPGASEEEIVAAAKAAAAHDFILGLPNGYDTHVGGLGAKLSGGQRQRVSIARAILKNAPILLLDEATSALDTESERQVQAALGKLMEGRTTIVIAHRLSTVIDADIIYVMEAGKVVEQGRHAELLALGGRYARLYANQLDTADNADAEDATGDKPAAAASSAASA